MFESRSYLIIPTSEVSKVDFSKVFETSADTLRKSVDGTKTFIKWGDSPYVDQPDFVTNISGKEGPYNHSQITTILSGTDWTKPQEE